MNKVNVNQLKHQIPHVPLILYTSHGLSPLSSVLITLDTWEPVRQICTDFCLKWSNSQKSTGLVISDFKSVSRLILSSALFEPSKYDSAIPFHTVPEFSRVSDPN